MIEEGDRSDEVFIILEGCVKVLARTGRDGLALIGFRKRGDLLGEMAALDDAPRSATVVACGDIIVQMIEGVGFRNIMDTQRAARQAVEQIVIDRLRTFMARVTGLSGRSVDVRITRVLAELSREHRRMMRRVSWLAVWQEAQLRPFRFGGRACTRLVTTRIPDLLPAGCPRIRVDATQPREDRPHESRGTRAGSPAPEGTQHRRREDRRDHWSPYGVRAPR
jgi:CRP-like cAMP-binding protein